MNQLDAIRVWVVWVQKMKQWPHFGDWSNYHFQLLSDEISDKSNVKIDRNTIRKIVESVNNGKPYSPHLTTKDALACYVGEKNWHQFIKQIHHPEKSDKRILWVVLSIITALLSVFILSFMYKNNKDLQFDFVIENPEGIIPHTIQCNYNFERLKTSDIYIDYGHVNPDGNYILQTIDKNSNINRHCFHYPGNYSIRLFIDGSVKADEKVWINSKDWFVYANDAASYISNHDVPDLLKEAGLPLLQHIPFSNILQKQISDSGWFFIPHENIMAIDGQTANYHLHLKNFRHFGADMQRTTFSIRFKDDNFGEGIHCSEAGIYLYCEHGIVGFKFAQKGCGRYTHYRVGEDFKAGRDSQLDFLIIDYKQFINLSVKGEADKIILLVDDEEIKTFSTQHKFGEIRGMHFWFKGSPYIDFVEMKDTNNVTYYRDDFSE